MSGHSKWSTIKRQKAINDQARGKVFSKLAKAISIAVKTGGGGNPDANAKLRMAIETAKSENMPKINIDRAIEKASTQGENLEEIIYEGFGLNGVGILVEAATDNRNRTAQEIKGIFERGGGTMAGPGSVLFNFEHKGEIGVRTADVNADMLKVIDLGVEDVEENDHELSIYVNAQATHETVEKLESSGFVILSSKLIQKPKNIVIITQQKEATKLLALLENLEDSDDVQNVYTNANFSENLELT